MPKMAFARHLPPPATRFRPVPGPRHKQNKRGVTMPLHRNGVLEDDPNLDMRAFGALSPRERVRLCLRLARHAQELAAATGPQFRSYHLIIAEQWLQLADVIQRANPAPNNGTDH